MLCALYFGMWEEGEGGVGGEGHVESGVALGGRHIWQSAVVSPYHEIKRPRALDLRYLHCRSQPKFTQPPMIPTSIAMPIMHLYQLTSTSLLGTPIRTTPYYAL
jgi:hypothetical protein